jgi:metal-dependent amidase/aminoacylase/carboxypeptidase family protein
MKLVEPIIAFQSELQQIRRDLHAHPELSYEEVRTADAVAARLTEWGIPVAADAGGEYLRPRLAPARQDARLRP